MIIRKAKEKDIPSQQNQADTHHAACHIKWNFPTGNTPVHQIADQVI